jgi:hypothetical protein
MWRMPQLGGDPEHDRVWMQAIVIPWTDDNGDGRIDAADGGDVLVIGGGLNPFGHQVVRLLEGRTGQYIHGFDALPFSRIVSWAVNPAAGDIDGDGFPELAVGDGSPSVSNSTVFLYNWDGSVRWLSPDLEWYQGFRALTIADLDGDGLAEILAGQFVLDADGNLRTTLMVPPCPESYPLDIDLDGTLEVACGGSVVRQDGTAVFASPYAALSAPAQLDGDPFPELLVVTSGDPVFQAIDHDGARIWAEDDVDLIAPGGQPTSFAAGDADGDGLSDLWASYSYASPPGSFITAWAHDGTELWRLLSSDGIAAGGSLAFLDGPLAYLHDEDVRVLGLDAASGDELLSLPNPQGTRWEAPVFVDLDGDGVGELLTTSDQDPTSGVRAWRDPGGCAARPFWNQHAYVPDWIGDDLRPAGPPAAPIDWPAVGMRQQRSDCACVQPPSVEVVVTTGCDPGAACATAMVTGGTTPLRLAWTLPDGSTTTETEPCFTVTSPGSVSIEVRDGRNCVATARADVAPAPARRVSIVVEPDCAAPVVQCAVATVENAPGPHALAWTLPDGTLTAEESPCFQVTELGIVSVVVTDADGCVMGAMAVVQPYVEPVLTELSAPGAATPLRVVRAGVGVRITWEPSPSGFPMAVWAGPMGAWDAAVAIACAPTATADDLDVAPARFYLAGETGCAGAAGPLGATSLGSPRLRPGSPCP